MEKRSVYNARLVVGTRKVATPQDNRLDPFLIWAGNADELTGLVREEPFTYAIRRNTTP